MERVFKRIKVGVLALQGAFREHVNIIRKLGAIAEEIRYPEQLYLLDGLIIPGGESTTISLLIKKYGFKAHLDIFYKNKKPIFGTCAGLILLAKKVNHEKFGLGYIDIEVERNAYGRQIDSFEEFINLNLDHNLETKRFKAIFIRAPIIKNAGENVKILGSANNNIALAQQENTVVSSFHPELGKDYRIHKYFLCMVEINKYRNREKNNYNNVQIT